jgi:hypothetical protein
LQKYVASLQANGLSGPNAWSMNHARYLAYASKSIDGGKLRIPVLFLHADFDYTRQTDLSRLAERIRADCEDLTEVLLRSGHWRRNRQSP